MPPEGSVTIETMDRRAEDRGQEAEEDQADRARSDVEKPGVSHRACVTPTR